MIRLIILILMHFVMFAPVSGQAQLSLSPEEKEILLNKNLDGALRGFIWGLPPEIIKENEKAMFLEEDFPEDDRNGRLFFMDYIQGMRCTIGYEFLDGKLFRAKIFVEEKYIAPTERFDDYLTIVRALNKRFGKPVQDQMQWFKDDEKRFPENWGWAIHRGELIIRTVWRNDDTLVTAFVGTTEPLNPSVQKPEMSVTYMSTGARRRSESKELFQLP